MSLPLRRAGCRQQYDSRAREDALAIQLYLFGGGLWGRRTTRRRSGGSVFVGWACDVGDNSNREGEGGRGPAQASAVVVTVTLL